MSEKKVDWLADKVLMALQDESELDASWIQGKMQSLAGLDRLAVLRWTVTGLDDENLNIVAKALGVAVNDLHAVQRVIAKI